MYEQEISCWKPQCVWIQPSGSDGAGHTGVLRFFLPHTSDSVPECLISTGSYHHFIFQGPRSGGSRDRVETVKGRHVGTRRVSRGH